MICSPGRQIDGWIRVVVVHTGVVVVGGFGLFGLVGFICHHISFIKSWMGFHHWLHHGGLFVIGLVSGFVIVGDHIGEDGLIAQLFHHGVDQGAPAL